MAGEGEACSLSELDLNPVIATPEGCWAVDWRLVV